MIVISTMPLVLSFRMSKLSDYLSELDVLGSRTLISVFTRRFVYALVVHEPGAY